MATATFDFTTPVTRPSQTGVLLGSPIQIDIVSGLAKVPYVQNTAAGAVPGTDTVLNIALTAADFQSIMAVLIARAQANGTPIPSGAVNIQP